MEIGEPKKNQDTNEMEIDLYKVKYREIRWMREAVKHHESDIDLDDFKKMGVGRDVLESLKAAIDKMRPPE